MNSIQGTISSLFHVKDKIVLVTGGSRGIGLMIATGYVMNGAKVYISSRSKQDCEKIAQQLTQLGPGQCIALPANLQNLNEVNELIQNLSKKEERLDVLINNAGATWGATIETYPDEAFEKIINLNLRRVFSLVQACLPMLSKAATRENPSSIINIGSIDGCRIPELETYAYSASKAALHHLTRVLAYHLPKRAPITCNALLPGPFPSKMMKGTLEKFQETIEAGIPLGRIGQPEDIIGACLYLSSKAGRYITGTAIPVDGGILVSAKM